MTILPGWPLRKQVRKRLARMRQRPCNAGQLIEIEGGLAAGTLR